MVIPVAAAGAAHQNARALRKRHHAHTLTTGDIVITPMIGIRKNSPPTRTFQMFHQRIQH